MLLGRYAAAARGREQFVVRCPVCESRSITVVLNSKSHASCSTCGATWIQEGSWQRAVRPGQVRLDADADAGVIVLPSPIRQPRRSRHAAAEHPADEAIAT
jgi:ribosomal protein S27E